MELDFFYLETVFRCIHLIGIVTVLGGILFYRTIYIPFADTQGEQFHSIRRYARRRARRMLWLNLFLIGLTGTLLWLTLPPPVPTRIHYFLAIKLFLFLFITVLILLQTLPLKNLQKAKRQAPFMATIILLMGLLCLFATALISTNINPFSVTFSQEPDAPPEEAPEFPADGE